MTVTVKVWLQSNYLVWLKREIAVAMSRACLMRRARLVAMGWDEAGEQKQPVLITARGV